MNDATSAAPPANADMVQLRRFLAAPVLPHPVTSSPMARALGTTILELDAKAGRIVLGYAPDDLFRQGAGVIQGGAVGAMLDSAMALISLAHIPEDKSVATASMTVNFLKGASARAYRAEGLIERAGRRLIYARASLSVEGETAPIATATSVLAVVG